MKRYTRQVECGGVTYLVTPLPVCGWRIQVADGVSHPDRGRLIPGTGAPDLASVERAIRRHALVPADATYKVCIPPTRSKHP